MVVDSKPDAFEVFRDWPELGGRQVRHVKYDPHQLVDPFWADFEAQLVGEAGVVAPTGDVVVGDRVAEPVAVFRVLCFAGRKHKLRTKCDLDLGKCFHQARPVFVGLRLPNQRALDVCAYGVWPVSAQAFL